MPWVWSSNLFTFHMDGVEGEGCGGSVTSGWLQFPDWELPSLSTIERYTRAINLCHCHMVPEGSYINGGTGIIELHFTTPLPCYLAALPNTMPSICPYTGDNEVASTCHTSASREFPCKGGVQRSLSPAILRPFCPAYMAQSGLSGLESPVTWRLQHALVRCIHCRVICNLWF